MSILKQYWVKIKTKPTGEEIDLTVLRASEEQITDAVEEAAKKKTDWPYSIVSIQQLDDYQF